MILINKIKLKYLIFTCFIFVFSSLVFASKLSDKERQITSMVASETPEQIALLEEIVNINSGTTNISGVRKVGERIEKYFKAMGFETGWVEEPPELKRAGTLMARREGKQGKRILLIGHLDTVFSADNKFKQFIRKGEMATGPGVIDDEGGVVVILYALKALYDANVLSNTNITVVLTGDEEDSGKPTTISRKPLIEAASKSDIALDFEPALSLDSATIARRGIAMWKIQSHGIGAHSASIFQKETGNGAVLELSRILNEMRIKFSKQKNISFSPGLILGGTEISFDKNEAKGTAFGRDNVVAQSALATGDIRFSTMNDRRRLEKQLHQILKKPLAGTHSSIDFVEGIPSMEPTKSNRQLLNLYSKVSVDLGGKKIHPTELSARGAGDISHVANRVSANLSGLGAFGGGAHTTNEYINLSALPIQTQRAAVLIYRLTR